MLPEFKNVTLLLFILHLDLSTLSAKLLQSDIWRGIFGIGKHLIAFFHLVFLGENLLNLRIIKTFLTGMIEHSFC